MDGARNADPGLLLMNYRPGGRGGRRKIWVTDWDQDGLPDVITDAKMGAAWFKGLGWDGELYKLTFKGDLTSTELEHHTTSPATVDWNADGVPDLLLGAEDGHIYYVEHYQ